MVVRKLESGNKKWEADLRNGLGQRKRKRFATKREAQAWEANQLRLRDAGDDTDDFSQAATMTVSDLFELWWERATTTGISKRGPLGPRTQMTRRSLWDTRIEPTWGTVCLDTITHDKVERWMQGESRRPRTSKATLHLTGRVFVQILDEGVRRGILPRNPAKDRLGKADYVPPNTTAKRHVYLTPRQLFLLAENMRGYRDKSMVLLAGLSGMRFGEVTALRWQDINFQSEEVYVTRAFSQGAGQRHLLKDTKNEEDRTVPLHAPTKTALLQLREQADDPKPGDLIFVSHLGNPLKTDSWRSRINSVVQRLHDAGELPTLTFHDLRHTAISIAVSAGLNIKIVQNIAGHASAQTTLDVYAGLFAEDLTASTQKINTFIGGHFLDTSKIVDMPGSASQCGCKAA